MEVVVVVFEVVVVVGDGVAETVYFYSGQRFLHHGGKIFSRWRLVNKFTQQP